MLAALLIWKRFALQKSAGRAFGRTEGDILLIAKCRCKYGEQQEKLEYSKQRHPRHDCEVIKKLDSAISALLGCSEEIESEQEERPKLKSSKGKRSKDGERSGQN